MAVEADEVAKAAADAAAFSPASFISESVLLGTDEEVGAGNVGNEPTKASRASAEDGKPVGAERRVDEVGDESSAMDAEVFCAAPAPAALL